MSFMKSNMLSMIYSQNISKYAQATFLSLLIILSVIAIGATPAIAQSKITITITDSGGTSDTATVPVEIPPDITGNGLPAQDLDGDGLYEDVDGDGAFDIFDVQALFDNQDATAVQENADLFNFDGEEGVGIFDIQALFELQSN